MSDSSEEEDLSKFKEAVDTSFIKQLQKKENNSKDLPKNENKKSERYLEEAAHYNDVKVSEKLQNQIYAKISAIINKKNEFVDIEQKIPKKHKIKGGIKLFMNSEGFMTCDVVEDTYTKAHNTESKKLKKKRRKIDTEETELDDTDKINEAVVSGDYIMSKEETKLWKSRRKEKLFKYKSSGKGKILTALN